jgi:general secretion pathway protein G
MRSGKLFGFTLVELLVVLSILALLLTLATPKYFTNIERAKEATLKQNLTTMRASIDHYFGDRGVYPKSLEELVELEYLNKVPVDPITESQETWVLTPPEPPLEGEVYNVTSGAEGKSRDGSTYADW